MSIDRLNFIIKRNRKYFKATCDKCGSDRGYKTPDHADRPYSSYFSIRPLKS